MNNACNAVLQLLLKIINVFQIVLTINFLTVGFALIVILLAQVAVDLILINAPSV